MFSDSIIYKRILLHNNIKKEETERKKQFLPVSVYLYALYQRNT